MRASRATPPMLAIHARIARIGEAPILYTGPPAPYIAHENKIRFVNPRAAPACPGAGDGKALNAR